MIHRLRDCASQPLGYMTEACWLDVIVVGALMRAHSVVFVGGADIKVGVFVEQCTESTSKCRNGLCC